MNIKDLYNEIKNETAKSQFGRGVIAYALEMLDPIIVGDYKDVNGDSEITALNLGHLLNHVDGNNYTLNKIWGNDAIGSVKSLCGEASMGGNFIIYDEEILERCCPPSQRKRNRSHSREIETNALYKAVCKIKRYVMRQVRNEAAKAV